MPLDPAPTRSPRRAAIYARFSTDRQNERSCEDQAFLCRQLAEREGLTVVAEYEDKAISGASTHGRLGLARLLRDARERRFDVVVCEDLDRLSRDQADLATIRKELTRFLEIQIITLHDGEVGAMHVGLKGLMSELFLSDLAKRTRRGQAGRVREGASAGGKSYGYDVDPVQKGRLHINPAEAEVVRRIFARYLAGQNCRAIAADLNADAIPSPRGGKWNASTIHGSAQRKNGILQNRLYAGQIVWNRQRFIKDPATGRRVSRLNPESEWQTAEVPDLAILDRSTFDAAQRRKASSSKRHAAHQRRPRHVFSGLIKCACCGASYTVVGNGRIGCAGFRERGDCTNRRTVALDHVERRVLLALRDQLAAPHLLAEYIRVYREETKRLAAQNRSRATADEKRLKELQAAIERTVDLLVSGSAPASLMARLHSMEAERDTLAQSLAEMATDTVVDLHPAAAARYRQFVEDLQTQLRTLRQGTPAEQLINSVRALVDGIYLTPPAESKKPVNLEVHGLLDAITPQYRGMLVAGARNAQSPIWVFAA